MTADKQVRQCKRPGPKPRLVGAVTVSVNLEERHRLLMAAYAKRHPDAESESAIIRRALELLCADITEDEMDEERKKTIL